MPFPHPHHIHGIDTKQLSERARKLLCKVTPPTKHGAYTPSNGHFHVLAWTLLAMPPARLQRFADHVGVLGAASILRKVLCGRRIIAFRRNLGQELYLFGMLRAPLLGTLHVPPENFEDPERVGAAVHGVGMAALHAHFNDPSCENPLLGSLVSARLNEVARTAASVLLPVDAPSGLLFQRVLREAEPILAGAFDTVRASP